MSQIASKITQALQTYFKTNPANHAVIGLSGGLDSAICLKLLVDAIGPSKVTCLVMPESGLTSPTNFQHAKTLSKFLNVNYHYIPINKFLTAYASIPWRPNKPAEQNIKARIRANILQHFAETHAALLVGTSNKTDLTIGYGAHHGELIGDIYPIGEIYKSDLPELARTLNLPEEIINKTPTRELSGGQSDENDLRISYKDLDNVLRQLNSGLTKEELLAKGINPNLLLKITRLIEENADKTNTSKTISIE
ncbi:NAD(+) synthase [Candidatus Peregrinibacteria bacterium HGW-Peregrinibacteria-1]|jgi:NAD+ synthase|nr:MAG: NAD(+) synthase [Candidatus Peregrinibacteria bacterium HGW-Peregrinibacteria-1]